MPVTIRGDVPKRIEALAAGLSDDNLRSLTVTLRDSLLQKLTGVTWSGKPSIYIMRGLTAHTEPMRTPIGGWWVGVGSLEILHREDAPPKTITQFLYWYQTQYMPEEKERRAAEKAIKAKKPTISPAAKEAQRIRQWHKDVLAQRVIIRAADLRDVDLRVRLRKLRADRNEAVRWAHLAEVRDIDAKLDKLNMQLAENIQRMRKAEARLAELRAEH